MIGIETDKPRQLLKIRFCGQVTPDETERHVEDVRDAVAVLEAGFRLLADLSQLEFMDPECAPHIGQTMEVCDQRGVSKVVRIIPDPRKDIGLNILSVFHYRRKVALLTCTTLEEAAEFLAT